MKPRLVILQAAPNGAFNGAGRIALARALWAGACSAVFHAALLIGLSIALTASDHTGPMTHLHATYAQEESLPRIEGHLSDLAELDRFNAPDDVGTVGLADAGGFAQSISFEMVPTGSAGGFSMALPAAGLADDLAHDLADGGRMASRSKGAGASFYGVEVAGDEFVFVVDMSGSMTGKRFRRARGEVRRSIEALADSQKFFVIFFSDGALPMPAQGLLEATAHNTRDALRWIKQVECGGLTKPLAALRLAIDLEPDAIFLLTDGQFDPLVADLIAQEQTGHVTPIHAIAFVSRDGEPMLKALANATGGTYRFVR